MKTLLSDKKRVLTIVACAILIISCIAGVIIYNETRWEKIFVIEYKDYNLDRHASEYEITNTTNKTYRNVKAVIEVTNVIGKTFRYEQNISSRFEPNQTVSFNIYYANTEREAEKRNTTLYYAESTIKKIVFE